MGQVKRGQVKRRVEMVRGVIPPWYDKEARNRFIVENPGLSQRELARYWGVSHVAIGNIRRKHDR